MLSLRKNPSLCSYMCKVSHVLYLLQRLSVTKWIHLHQGDDGLKSVFKKVYDILNENGVFILEPQPYSSYMKRAKTDKVRNKKMALSWTD